MLILARMRCNPPELAVDACRDAAARALWAERAADGGVLYVPQALQQHPQSTRRNALPVKLIDGSLVMCHKHLACALV